jgi:hypothetical protein
MCQPSTAPALPGLWSLGGFEREESSEVYQQGDLDKVLCETVLGPDCRTQQGCVAWGGSLGTELSQSCTVQSSEEKKRRGPEWTEWGFWGHRQVLLRVMGHF